MPTELLLVLSGLFAGSFGALLGLGGGVLIVPILTLGFGVPLPTAVGTSLICVIATSTGAAAINVRAGRADVRLGITLASGTVVGALVGGLVAGFLPERIIAGLFALLMLYTAATMARGLVQGRAGEPDAAEVGAAVGVPAYRTRRVPAAVGGAFVGGGVSALLGVGGGVIMVPLMHLVMRVPMRIAVATSNFMIGMSAAAGAYAYLFRGDIDARLAAPMVLGVAAGAALGAGVSGRIRSTWLVAAFVVLVGYVAVRMALLALGVEGS